MRFQNPRAIVDASGGRYDTDAPASTQAHRISASRLSADAAAAASSTSTPATGFA
jgi:hypothetical protein